MKLVFTNHAIERMKQRKISEFLVQMTVTSPDKISSSNPGMRYVKMLPDGYPLIVGAHYDSGKLVISTVFIKGKP